MSEYSVESLQRLILAQHAGTSTEAIDALRAFSDLREQIERAREGVTPEVVIKAWDVFSSTKGAAIATGAGGDPLKYMQSALQSVAHLLPSGERGVVDAKSQWPDWVNNAISAAFNEGCRQTREAMTAEPVAQGEAPEYGTPAMCDMLIRRCGQLREEVIAAKRAAQPASPEQLAGRQGDCTIEAVGRVERDRTGELGVNWFLEGGLHAVGEGAVLLCADRNDLTDDEGCATVYTHPAAPVGVPDGFVLVPREPTEAMCGVIEYGAASRMCETRLSERVDFLRKAIAAAPSAPQEKKACTRNCDCVGPCKMGDE